MTIIQHLKKKANISKGLIIEGGEEADKGALVLIC